MRAQIAVLAVLAGAAAWPVPAGGARARLAAGERAVLAPRFDVEVEGAKQDAAPVTWQRDGADLILASVNQRFTAVARLSAGGEAVTLEVAIIYTQAVTVEREAIVLELPTPVRMLGRDLRFARVEREQRVDRGTPLVVAAGPPGEGELVVSGERGFVAARVTASRKRATLALVLDDAAAHPFHPRKACDKRWRGDKKAKRVDQSRTRRAAADVVFARAEIYLAAPGTAFSPLIVERWPAGARAAVVFTDHADRTDPEGLRVIAGAFRDRKLALTKTFFARGEPGALDDEGVRALVAELVAAGSEAGSHSITPEPDDRATVAAGLAAFEPYGAQTWIDHQPDTNCEALSTHGWDEASPYASSRALVDAGYRWVWADSDIPKGKRAINVFAPARGKEAFAPIFPLPAEPRLWMFRAVWFLDHPRVLDQKLDDQALDALEEERGLFVAHCYLTPTSKTTQGDKLRRRNVIAVDKKGARTLVKHMTKILDRLATRVAGGSLVSLTLRAAGERLLLAGGVVVRYRKGGAVVSHAAGQAVPGLTLAAAGELALDGATATGSRQGDDRGTIWFDLPAGKDVTVKGTFFTPAPLALSLEEP